MTDDPKPEAPEADEEFERVPKNLVNTPHRPHNERGGEPKPAPKATYAKAGKSGGK